MDYLGSPNPRLILREISDPKPSSDYQSIRYVRCKADARGHTLVDTVVHTPCPPIQKALVSICQLDRCPVALVSGLK